MPFRGGGKARGRARGGTGRRARALGVRSLAREGTYMSANAWRMLVYITPFSLGFYTACVLLAI